MNHILETMEEGTDETPDDKPIRRAQVGRVGNG